jgi:cell division transport system permease protein
MTGAAVLTVAVSLSLVGGALLLKQGVSNATVRWKGGVELAIFMQLGASQGETNAVQHQLTDMQSSGLVKSFHYVDQESAYREFRQLFADQPDLVNTVSASDLPPSFRVAPASASETQIIGNRFTSLPGVKEVNYAAKAIDNMVKVSRVLQWVALGFAAALMLSAVVLILNTIRMAIFTRRREVAVMKLVGATNWFIRVPFMMEGFVQGLIGAAVAFALVFLGRDLVASFVHHYGLRLFNDFIVPLGAAVSTGILVLIVGILVGVVSSAFAVRRFLDV